MLFGLDQKALFLQFLGDFLPYYKSVLAFIMQTIGIQRCVVIKNINGFQMMLFSQRFVIYIVGRGHL